MSYRQQRPNILLIVLDTQRADRLSCYQSDPGSIPTTPHLDRFAQESTLFERAISPAQWTIPAHASMFTGEYPSTHQTVQADIELGRPYMTLAELLKVNGYDTVGFCNNPLVGILKNGLRRGFDSFYNYGGALPTRPAFATPLPTPLNKAIEEYTQFWRKISYPFQNAFAQSDWLFQLALQPWLVPLWTHLAHFKGNTQVSIQDLCVYLQQAAYAQSSPQADAVKPFFCFVNLMEPHLPYWPPEPFLRQFLPYLSQDRRARDFLRTYNTQPYRWMAPLADPLSPLESQVLSDVYNAEVAYQDSLLGKLFTTLTDTGLDQNTVVVVVADHGEGLGEHQFVGHAFVVFEELVRVPLLIRYPEVFPAGQRIATPVSTRRIFHTLLELAGAATPIKGRIRLNRQLRREINRLSLSQTVNDQDPEAGVLTEAFPPHILIRAMQKREDNLLQAQHCHSTRRALYQGNTKLIQVGQEVSLFDIHLDPAEIMDHGSEQPDKVSGLEDTLNQMILTAEKRRSMTEPSPRQISFEDDQDLVRRMQDLGYLE